MDIRQFETRKQEHIVHALSPANEARGLSGLESVRLIHDALPELDFSDVLLESDRFGRPSKTPFYIAGMTAGHPDAAEINLRLARACALRGWAMGVGSQRRELVQSSADRAPWEAIRQVAPQLELFANLGLSQVISTPIDSVRRVIDSIRASALVVHANALQEALQPEGTPSFAGAVSALKRLCQEVEIPVVLKETGCGFSARTLTKLRGVGLAAVDVSGLGGTHWGRIEGARAQAVDPIRNLASMTFATWGESTVDSVLSARDVLPEVEVWGSGGVRSGLDAAKLLALGASQAGYAKPALEAAIAGPEALLQWMERQETELKIALFCTGSASARELRRKEGIWQRSGT